MKTIFIYDIMSDVIKPDLDKKKKNLHEFCIIIK